MDILLYHAINSIHFRNMRTIIITGKGKNLNGSSLNLSQFLFQIIFLSIGHRDQIREGIPISYPFNLINIDMDFIMAPTPIQRHLSYIKNKYLDTQLIKN